MTVLTIISYITCNDTSERPNIQNSDADTFKAF